MLKRKRLTIIILIIAFVFIFTGFTSATKVAVIGFESTGLSWTDNKDFERDVLESIAAKYSSELASENIIEVVDSSRVNSVLKQMEYRPGDKIGLSNAVQAARMVESNLFILGSLEKLKIIEKGELSIGPLSFSGIEAEAVLNARLVDTLTGKVLSTYSASAMEADTGMEISDMRNVSFGSEAFADSAVSKAIDAAVVKLVKDTVNKKESFDEASEIEKAEPIQAEVVAKVGESLVINKGSEDGVKAEQIGKLERELELDSGDSLSISLGEIVVSSVDSTNSLIKVNDPKEEPEVGDFVTIEPNNDFFAQASSPSIDSPGSYVKKVETPNFIIYIERAVAVGDKATVYGTVEAKKEATEFTLIYKDKLFSFYDHKGQKRETNEKYLILGSNTEPEYGKYHNDSRDVRRERKEKEYIGERAFKLTELILPGYPKQIGWKFDQVPEDLNHISRIEFIVGTPEAGEIKIMVEDIPTIRSY